MLKRITPTIFLVIVALIFQYYYLESSLMVFSSAYKPYEYTIDDYTLKIDFPGTTKVYLTPDKGEEMRINIYFVDNKLAFRGYIQVWLLADLQYFLNDSKAKSPYNFTSYTMNNIKQNNYPGFKEEWSADFGKKSISAQEFWLKINTSKEAVRISFFTDSENFPDELDNTVNHIANSLKIVTEN